MFKRKEADELLEDALMIIQQDLERLTKNSMAGTLEPSDARTVNDYVRTLISLQKDNRASAKELDYTTLKDEDLKRELEEVLRNDKGAS